MIRIGQEITTQKSGTKGTVLEIVECKNGSLRLRIDTGYEELWTTYRLTPYDLVS